MIRATSTGSRSDDLSSYTGEESLNRELAEADSKDKARVGVSVDTRSSLGNAFLEMTGLLGSGKFYQPTENIDANGYSVNVAKPQWIHFALPVVKSIAPGNNLYDRLGKPRTPPRMTQRQVFHDVPSNTFDNFNTLIWPEIVNELGEMTVKLQSKQWARCEELLAILSLLPYGLEDLVGVSSSFIKIPNPKNIRVTSTYGFHIQAADSRWQTVDHTCGMDFTQEYQWKDVRNRRFIASMINFGPDKGDHWASYIFDRLNNIFLYFDSLVNGRDDRFRASTLAFRQQISKNGFPYNFRAICMPIQNQLEGWECGYISVFMLFVTLKGWGDRRKTAMNNAL